MSDCTIRIVNGALDAGSLVTLRTIQEHDALHLAETMIDTILMISNGLMQIESLRSLAMHEEIEQIHIKVRTLNTKVHDAHRKWERAD